MLKITYLDISSMSITKNPFLFFRAGCEIMYVRDSSFSSGSPFDPVGIHMRGVNQAYMTNILAANLYSRCA